ncbi:MAG: hypothetical protein JWQ43_1208 [Glaciihabitans sp.]|nr:hypothetical protein [Glaciihabitans sp.]
MSGFDLVVVLGQSNASGTNTDFEPDGLDARDPRILTFPATGEDARTIVPAREPLAPIGGHPPGGMGPGGPFSAALLPTLAPDRRILIVPAAMGGTGMRNHGTFAGVWLPGFQLGDAVNLFDAAVDHVHAALKAAGANSRIAAVIWHQGESDGGRTEEDYAADLDVLVAELRRQIPESATSPFIAGQLPLERLAAYPDHAGVDAALRRLPERVALTGFAPAPPIGHVNDVTTHLAASGQRILGANYFAAYQKL